MHIERVDAHAFGPLQGATLELGPGCNVVHGPNESGKSSWHSALTTALAGRRRGRGRPTAEQDFAERHRPWSGGRWVVGARLRLADGRVVTILQDLDDPSRCQAHDQTGRPVLDEILGDGMPDASRWLGLDRDAFRACASVRQADVAQLDEGAGALQHYLQQAATTRKAESTAGAALDRLRAFKVEAIGADRKNAVKPLRRALDRLTAADQTLAEASAAHACLIDATEACALLVDRAERATLERRATEAADADAQAVRLELTTARVAELTARCPGPPAPLDQDDEQAQDVAAALRRWDERPEVPVASGPSADELRARLEEPTPFFGDTEIHPSVDDAVRGALHARHAVEFHHKAEPPAQALPDGTEPVELRELANRLRDEPAPTAPGPRATTPPSVPILVAAAAVVGGAALAFAGQVLLAALVAAACIVVALVIAGRRHGPAVEPQPATPSSPVRARIAHLGLPADAGSLERLADRFEHHGSWVDEDRVLRDGARRAWSDAKQAIEARLGQAGDRGATLEDLVTAYRASCRRTADDQRAAAVARGQLEAALVRAEAAEDAACRARELCEAASRALRSAAAVVEVRGADDESLADGLRRWHQARRTRLAEAETCRQEWDRLQRFGGGRPLADWIAERDEARLRADALLGAVDADLLARVHGEGVTLATRVATERTAAQQAHEARAALEVRQADVISVAEAAEAAAAARTELARVRELDQVLSTTISCLGDAQDRLYRSIAPVLAQRLTDVLPAVTAGRYQDVTVDPETLQVRVRLSDGTLHPAGLLSHGTAEQVYLLLRVAMAERLVSGEESCPLLLDDVTVHCDPDRTQAILDLLARVAEDRQVVLFTQEPDVVAWAEETLTGDRHRVIALDRPTVPA